MNIKNNFILPAIAGVIFTGAEANADLFKCVACPAGYRCDGYTKTQCGAGTYAKAGSGSCTSCPAGHTSSAGASECTAPSPDSPDNWTLVYNYSSGEGSASLSAGTYIVSLHGGNGGSYKPNYKNNTNTAGFSGGTVTYKFTVNSSWTFKYGVGMNGGDGNSNQSSGGGGGSWVAINNQYIVAGGGGGGRSDFSHGNGGSGGAVGSGSSSYEETLGDSDGNCGYSSIFGGNSGNYGNFINHRNDDGGKCQQSVSRGNAEGEADSYYSCVDGTGINSYNIAKCPVSGGIGGSAEGITLYPGYGRTKVGGDSGQAGSATHSSNIPGSLSGFACGTSSGCVKLYKFKY